MKILNELDLDNVVFIDIETVAGAEKLTKDNPLWDSWDYKMKHGRDPIGGDDAVKAFSEKAALFAEFGKIVCITIGKIKDGVLKMKTFVDENEERLLTDFCGTLTNITQANKKTVLCGHAVKGFDLPWIMRRCIVNQVNLPTLIDTGHLKPWETTTIDTADLWKGTGFNGGSLIAIAVALGLSNPKDELEGYQTTETYYKDKDWKAKMAKYCEKDVLTVANIVRKCRHESVVEGEAAEIKEKTVGVLQRIYNSGAISKADEKQVLKIYNTLTAEEKTIADLILSVAKKNK